MSQVEVSFRVIVPGIREPIGVAAGDQGGIVVLARKVGCRVRPRGRARPASEVGRDDARTAEAVDPGNTRRAAQEAGKDVAAVEEKFEKHKKFADEKVRALAKAESDVRALEGKLEDANREIRDAKAGGDAEKAEVTELRTKTAAQAKDLWAKAKELVKAREETRYVSFYSVWAIG